MDCRTTFIMKTRTCVAFMIILTRSLIWTQGVVDDVSLIEETQTSRNIVNMFSTETSFLIEISSATRHINENTHFSINPTSSSQITSSVSTETIITQLNKVSQLINQSDIVNSSLTSIFHTDDFVLQSSSETVGTTSVTSLHLIQFTQFESTSISLPLSKQMTPLNSITSDLSDSLLYTNYLRVTSLDYNHFTEQPYTPGFSSVDNTLNDFTKYVISKAYTSVTLSSKDSMKDSNIGLLTTLIQSGHTISTLLVLSTITPSVSIDAKTPSISVNYTTDFDNVNSTISKTNDQINTTTLESYTDSLISSAYYQTIMSDEVLTSTSENKYTTHSSFDFYITTSSELNIDERLSDSNASFTSSLVGTFPLTEKHPPYPTKFSPYSLSLQTLATTSLFVSSSVQQTLTIETKLPSAAVGISLTVPESTSFRTLEFKTVNESMSLSPYISVIGTSGQLDLYTSFRTIEEKSETQSYSLISKTQKTSHLQSNTSYAHMLSTPIQGTNSGVKFVSASMVIILNKTSLWNFTEAALNATSENGVKGDTDLPWKVLTILFATTAAAMFFITLFSLCCCCYHRRKAKENSTIKKYKEGNLVSNKKAKAEHHKQQRILRSTEKLKIKTKQVEDLCQKRRETAQIKERKKAQEKKLKESKRLSKRNLLAHGFVAPISETDTNTGRRDLSEQHTEIMELGYRNSTNAVGEINHNEAFETVTENSTPTELYKKSHNNTISQNGSVAFLSVRGQTDDDVQYEQFEKRSRKKTRTSLVSLPLTKENIDTRSPADVKNITGNLETKF